MRAETLPSPNIGARGHMLRQASANTISQVQIAAAFYPNGKHPDAAALKAFFDACSAAAAALSDGSTPAPPPTPSTYYAIVPLLGQSLMAGRGARNSGVDTEDARIKQFPNIAADTTTYRTIRDSIYPEYHPEDHRGDNEIGLGQSIAKAILPTLPSDAVILLVPCAWGGTSMVNTANNSAPNAPQWAVGRSLYEGAVAQTIAALNAARAVYPNSRVHSVHFAQGNTDSVVGLEGQYDTALRAVISDFRSRVPTAASAPWTISSMAPDGATGIDNHAGKAAIDAVHRAVAASVANCTYLPGPYGALLADGIHYTSAGTRLLGDRQGKSAAGIQSVGFDKIVRSAPEGNTGTTDLTFGFVRSTPSGAVSVPVTFSAGATSADDFAGGAYPSGLVANFASGSLTASITLSVAGDMVVEGDESFTLTVAPPAGYVASPRPSATGTIINDDTSGGTGTNLVQSPQAFDQWSSTSLTVTPDTTANPVSGTTNADSTSETAGGTSARNLSAPTAGAPSLQSGQVYTFAVDAKANGRGVLQIYLPSALGATSTSMWANFDLTNGVLGTKAASNAEASILSLGNGFYRCSLTVTIGTTAAATMTLSSQISTSATRNNTYAGTAGQASHILANAQIVAGSAANAF